MANSEDPDQTLKDPSNMGFHHLHTCMLLLYQILGHLPKNTLSTFGS